MLYGVFAHQWYINEIAALFIMMAIAVVCESNSRE